MLSQSTTTTLHYFLLVDANFVEQRLEVVPGDVCIVGVVGKFNIYQRDFDVLPDDTVVAKTCTTSPVSRFLWDKTTGHITHAITRSGSVYALGEELDAKALEPGSVTAELGRNNKRVVTVAEYEARTTKL